MQAKPRVGLILMQTELSAGKETDQLRRTVEGDAQALAGQLSSWFDLLGPWAVSSNETLLACQAALRESEMDMLLLVHQTWSQDNRLAQVLEAAGSRPLVVWCYLPWRRVPHPASLNDLLRGSGPVGTFAALGFLRDLNMPFKFVFGAPDDPRLVRDLQTTARAAQVRAALRSARIGLLPSSGEIPGANVTVQSLRDEIGPEALAISAAELGAIVNDIPHARIEGFIEQIRARCTVLDVDDDLLLRSARAALGLAEAAAVHRLDVLAVDSSSPELIQAVGLRPALYPNLTGVLPTLFQPEADLAAGVANFILHRLAGSPTFFVELWFWDEAKNTWLGGHHGMQNPALAGDGPAFVCPDHYINCPAEFQGAQFQFMARPGRITLFQLRAAPTGWQAAAATGVCLEGQPWTDSLSHASIRLDSPIPQFLQRAAETGFSQHWIMAYGSRLPELEALCELAGVRLKVITYS